MLLGGSGICFHRPLCRRCGMAAAPPCSASKYRVFGPRSARPRHNARVVLSDLRCVMRMRLGCDLEVGSESRSNPPRPVLLVSASGRVSGFGRFQTHEPVFTVPILIICRNY